jgi:hypothetical protein
MSDPVILPAAENFLRPPGIPARLLESPPHRVLLATRRTGCSQLPANKRSHDMPYLRTAFLATTAVGLMAPATPAFAEIITTPDGH